MEIAKALNGEIINGDSLQIYKSSDVVTNKIPENERDGIVHHLMDFVNPADDYDVTQYVRKATRTMEAIHARNKLPILVGGTHYYVQSLLFPHRLMPAVRQQEQQQHHSHPILQSSAEELLTFLGEVDPVMAQRWHPRDIRKIRRCVEIYLEHGVPPSEMYAKQQQQQQQLKGADGLTTTAENKVCFLWLYTQPEILANRIDERLQYMLKQGAVDEFKALFDLECRLEGKQGQPVDLGGGIFKAIGYKELRAYFKDDKSDTVAYQKAVQGMKLATNRYAKNQNKWIRNTLIPLCQNQAVEDVAIYALDTSDAQKWNDEVLGVSLKVLEKFFDGSPIDPKTTSSIASSLLTPRKSYLLSSRPDLWEVNVCEYCSRKGSNMVFNTRADWDTHLQSRRHRNVMRKTARRNELCATTIANQASDNVPIT